MNGPVDTLVGKQFGRLVVVADSGQRTRSNNRLWYCRCVCGRLTLAPKTNLVRGLTQSCGCLRSERLAERNRRRTARTDASHTPEYLAWQAMLRRCYDPNDPAYTRHGGRGVTVHETWRNSFLAFLRDVGARPSAKHVLDLWPNPDGHYEPGNVRWAKAKESARRGALVVTIDGVTKSIADWAREIGVSRRSLWKQIQKGTPPVETVRAARARSRHITPDADGMYRVEAIVHRIGNDGKYVTIPASVTRAIAAGRRRKRLYIAVVSEAVSWIAKLQLDSNSMSARLYLPKKLFGNYTSGDKIMLRVTEAYGLKAAQHRRMLEL